MLSEQILLKLTPELSELITKAFSKHLKDSGEYISRAEYLRKMIEEKCQMELGKK